MKKLLIGTLGLIVLLTAAAPALADTNVSFVMAGRSGPAWHPGWGPRHHHRWHGQRPVVYNITPSTYYVGPPRPVVYHTTVVQPTPIYTSSVIASPSSPTFIDGMGQTCREYQSTGWVGGRARQIYGTACLQPDGSWRVVD